MPLAVLRPEIWESSLTVLHLTPESSQLLPDECFAKPSAFLHLHCCLLKSDHHHLPLHSCGGLLLALLLYFLLVLFNPLSPQCSEFLFHYTSVLQTLYLSLLFTVVRAVNLLLCVSPSPTLSSLPSGPLYGTSPLLRSHHLLPAWLMHPHPSGLA